MRNKKVKKEFDKKINLLARYDLYKKKNNKLPVSDEEYQDLKDEILILKSRYPSIEKYADNLVLRAELKYDDGRIYKGAIKSVEQQVPHGDGFMYLSSSDHDPESISHGKKLTDNPWDYVGEFKNGVFDGKGEYTCDGNYSYKGEWKKSHFHGKGKLVLKKTKEVYEGEFVKSEKNGYGVLIVGDQYRTEGQWKNNQLHGNGKITFLKSTEHEEKGTTIKGIFLKGLQQGKFEKTFPNGDIMDCMFKDSVCTKAKYRGEKKWTSFKKPKT